MSVFDTTLSSSQRHVLCKQLEVNYGLRQGALANSEQQAIKTNERATNDQCKTFIKNKYL